MSSDDHHPGGTKQGKGRAGMTEADIKDRQNFELGQRSQETDQARNQSNRTPAESTEVLDLGIVIQALQSGHTLCCRGCGAKTPLLQVLKSAADQARVSYSLHVSSSRVLPPQPGKREGIALEPVARPAK